MPAASRTPILGLLAEQRWFTKMGEPAATLAAAALLNEPTLRAPILDWIATTLDADLPDDIVTFVPEVIHADGKRPDIVGFDSERRPRLIIEFKFGAEIDARQIAAYRREQATRLGPDRNDAVTVLVVPERRSHEAGEELELVSTILPDLVRPGDLLAGTGWATWEEWLSVWDKTFGDMDHAHVTAAADLLQFQALCRSLLKTVCDPLGPSVAGPAWRDRQQEILWLPELVAARLALSLWDEGHLRHRRDERKVPFRRRRSVTVCWEWPMTVATIGIRPDLGDSGLSPLWLQFRKDGSADFDGVRSRIAASRLAARARNDAGHLWLPIDLPPDKGNDDLIDGAVRQALAIVELVADPS